MSYYDRWKPSSCVGDHEADNSSNAMSEILSPTAPAVPFRYDTGIVNTPAIPFTSPPCRPVYDGKHVADEIVPSPPVHNRIPFFKTVKAIILIVILAVVVTGARRHHWGNMCNA